MERDGKNDISKKLCYKLRKKQRSYMKAMYPKLQIHNEHIRSLDKAISQMTHYYPRLLKDELEVFTVMATGSAATFPGNSKRYKKIRKKLQEDLAAEIAEDASESFERDCPSAATDLSSGTEASEMIISTGPEVMTDVAARSSSYTRKWALDLPTPNFDQQEVDCLDHATCPQTLVYGEISTDPLQTSQMNDMGNPQASMHVKGQDVLNSTSDKPITDGPMSSEDTEVANFMDE